MMYTRGIISDAIVSLSRSLGLDPSQATSIDLSQSASFESLKIFLIPRITALLDHNPDYLMSVLYRIDVDEAKVKDVLNNCPSEELASALADLMIERELQKVETRRAYRQSDNPSNK